MQYLLGWLVAWLHAPGEKDIIAGVSHNRSCDHFEVAAYPKVTENAKSECH